MMRGRTDEGTSGDSSSDPPAKAGSKRTVPAGALVKVACIAAGCTAVALGGPEWDFSPGEPWRPPLDCSGGCKPVPAAKLAAVRALRDRLTSEGFLSATTRRFHRRGASAEIDAAQDGVGAAHVVEFPAGEMTQALLRRHLHANEPLLIRGNPALAGLAGRWTDRELAARAGEVGVRVERSTTGRFGHMEPGWSVVPGFMQYSEFLRQYRGGSTDHIHDSSSSSVSRTPASSGLAYVATQMPQELALDIELPSWARGTVTNATAANLFLWHGATDRVSLLHADRAENLLFVGESCQIQRPSLKLI
jgi:hypothetical protein